MDKNIDFWEIFISGARGRNVPQQYVNIVFFASLLVNRYWNIYLYCVVIKQNISAQNSHITFLKKMPWLPFLGSITPNMQKVH